MKIDIKQTREALQKFDLTHLFIEELGWSKPRNPRPVSFEIEGQTFSRRELAQLGGVVVFEITAADEQIPPPPLRKAIHKEISALARENLLIFLDHPAGDKTTQSVWYWVKREGKNKQSPREHAYFRGQPGDLFLSKLDAMAVDFQDIAKSPTVTEVAERLKEALDVERVTRKFYNDFKTVHTQFLEHIEGVGEEHDRRWYASVLLNRLMFIYFLQRKGFVDNGNLNYLQNKLIASQEQGPDRYYETFLKRLFFEGFAKPAALRDPADNALLGNIVYLNGGLFLQHPVEARWPGIKVADAAFENIYDLFGRYSWNLDDTPGGQDDEINPDVLGYIFERYINQKEFGAYYTAPEITEYLCRQTIENLILEPINSPAHPAAGLAGRHFATLNDLLIKMDAGLCRELFGEVLPKLSLLDPACGSGAFLVAALKTLINVYSAVIGKIEFLNVPDLKDALNKIRGAHPSLNYFIKKQIITQNLFGVDIMEEATEIARLRLFLALVASASSVDDLEPLPNIDFNILAGNSLVGLLRVNETEYQGRLGDQPYADLVKDKNHLVDIYRNTSLLAGTGGQLGLAQEYNGTLQQLREEIERFRDEATQNLNNILVDQFRRLGIKHEQATWDNTKKAEGKPVKSTITASHIAGLHPFHWGFEFDRVMNNSGGFDAVITNPPWEIFKPQAKEFFQEYSDLVTKKKMTIKEFEEEQGKLLQDPETLTAWLQYLSGFPHVNQYFRTVSQYSNQISEVNNKKTGTDINLYKLFVEQCYNLLREGGQCGIVVPSGIYTDLGTKQLREMLFTKTAITGLFGFENRKEIFEGVHRSFKFVVLSFKKGGQTTEIKSAFMRLDVEELDRFPQDGALPISVDLIRQLSPDSLSIMEFKNIQEIQIAQKMLKFPSLGEKITGKWNLSMSREFHMTDDRNLFQTKFEPDCLPLYEGKMIHQFTHIWAKPTFWIPEAKGRKALLGRSVENNQILGYQTYRLAMRSIASNTNERSLILSIVPPRAFSGNSLVMNTNKFPNYESQLFCLAMLNSFVADWLLRIKVTTNINLFYVYQLPVPRLSEGDPQFQPIVERAARLICTTPEFADLWQAVMGEPWQEKLAATGEVERGRLRAELDGLVAHLYGLTETEFAYILGTFPLVAEPIKLAAQNAYRDFAPKSEEQQLMALISRGENEQVEFKRMATDNKEKVIQGIAAFLNSPKGGDFLIGVEDTGIIYGVESDYLKANPSKPNADSYQMYLQQSIQNGLDEDFALFYQISIIRVQGKDICQIKIKPADRPVYLKSGEFYRRNGNQKEKLSPKATIEYIKQRWG